MKQSIKITIIPKHDQKILFAVDDNYHLLYMKLSAGHQPESRINSLIQKKLSVVANEIKVIKVINSEDQINIIYQVGFSKQDYISILERSNLKWVSIDKLSDCNLDDETAFIISQVKVDLLEGVVVNNSTINHKYILYTDGGSRGNPGHSAIGYAIFDNNQKIFEGYEYIGIANSSIAEYQALARGLEVALAMEIVNLECRVDNLMIVKHLNNQYDVKNRELWPINQRINNVLLGFKVVKFIHIKRDLNEIADSLVNKALNEYLLKK